MLFIVIAGPCRYGRNRTDNTLMMVVRGMLICLWGDLGNRFAFKEPTPLISHNDLSLPNSTSLISHGEQRLSIIREP